VKVGGGDPLLWNRTIWSQQTELPCEPGDEIHLCF